MQFRRGMEPFALKKRKWSGLVLALVGAVWLSLGIVSAMYLADSRAASASAIVSE